MSGYHRSGTMVKILCQCIALLSRGKNLNPHLLCY